MFKISCEITQNIYQWNEKETYFQNQSGFLPYCKIKVRWMRANITRQYDKSAPSFRTFGFFELIIYLPLQGEWSCTKCNNKKKMQLKVKRWQKKLRNMLLSVIYKRCSWKVKDIGILIKYNIWKCNWLTNVDI
jgi:hypothetical protein